MSSVPHPLTQSENNKTSVTLTRGVIYAGGPACDAPSVSEGHPSGPTSIEPPPFPQTTGSSHRGPTQVARLRPLMLNVYLAPLPARTVRQSQSTHTARNARNSPLKSRSGGSTGKGTRTIISPTTQCSKVDFFLGPIIINQKMS